MSINLNEQLINIELWEEAKWSMTAMFSDKENPPILGFIFFNKQKTIELFEELLSKITNTDKCDELRISIIEEEILEKSYPYIIHINSSVESKDKFIKNQGRFSKMNPSDNGSLQLFKKEYKKHGKYFVMPLFVNENSKLEPLFEYMIEKKEVLFRKSSEITEGDIDYGVLKSE